MEPSIITETPSPLAAAESFSAHKAIRQGKEAPTSEAKPVVPAPLAKTAEPDSSVQDTPEEKQKRDRSFNGRISELTTARDDWKGKYEALEKELRETRTRKPDPEPPKPEVKPGAEVPRPKLADFVKAAKSDESYDEVVERWTDAVDEWKEKKRTAESQQTEQTERQKAVVEKAKAKMEKAREKYADYDHVTAGDLQAGTGLILSKPMIEYFLEEEDGVDVIYALGKDSDEYKRIKALPADRQQSALGKFAAKLSSEEKKPEPPKPVPVVSKAPAPPTKVGGAEEPAPKSAKEARNMAEYKKLRAQG